MHLQCCGATAREVLCLDSKVAATGIRKLTVPPFLSTLSAGIPKMGILSKSARACWQRAWGTAKLATNIAILMRTSPPRPSGLQSETDPLSEIAYFVQENNFGACVAY